MVVNLADDPLLTDIVDFPGDCLMGDGWCPSRVKGHVVALPKFNQSSWVFHDDCASSVLDAGIVPGRPLVSIQWDLG